MVPWNSSDTAWRLSPLGSTRFGGRFRSVGAQHRLLSRQLPAFSEKFWQPAQVDGGHRQSEYQLGAFEATQLQLAQRAVLLAIAEDGFDQLANDLTHCVA